jgi:hypothetical protein
MKKTKIFIVALILGILAMQPTKAQRIIDTTDSNTPNICEGITTIDLVYDPITDSVRQIVMPEMYKNIYAKPKTSAEQSSRMKAIEQKQSKLEQAIEDNTQALITDIILDGIKIILIIIAMVWLWRCLNKKD